MDPFLLCALLLIAVGAGIVGALFGLGGGIIFIPVLTILYSMDAAAAVAVSLVGIVATSTSSASKYVGEGKSNIRLGMLLEITTSTGAIIGAAIAVYLENGILLVLFSCVMLYSGIRTALSPERGDVSAEERTDMSFGYADEKAPGEHWYTVRNVGSGMALCTGAGMLSSMTGVGGGALKVPLMNIHMHVPIKAATATSSYMIGITAFSGAVIYFLHGDVVPDVAAAVAVGAFMGALAGTRLSSMIDAGALKKYMSVVFFCIAAITLLEAGGVL